MTAPLPAVPDGFVPLFRTSPFLDLTGPYFHRPLTQGFLIGLRIAPMHTNASGTWHGGAIATLADVALGYVTAASRKPPLRMVTSSLGIDYVWRRRSVIGYRPRCRSPMPAAAWPLRRP